LVTVVIMDKKKKDEEEPDIKEEDEDEPGHEEDDDIRQARFENISIDGMNMSQLEHLARLGLMSTMRGRESKEAPRVKQIENIEISFKNW